MDIDTRKSVCASFGLVYFAVAFTTTAMALVYSDRLTTVEGILLTLLAVFFGITGTLFWALEN